MLPALDHALSIESRPVADTPFTLTGARCTIRGLEAHGVGDVLVDDSVVLRACRLADVRCTAFQITPLGVTRELRAGLVTITEKIVVAPHAGAFAVEWTADAAIDLPLTAELIGTAPQFTFSNNSDSAHVTLTALQPVQLVVSFASPTHVDPAAWIQQHRAAAERRSQAWLTAELPHADLTHALAWSQFRLANRAAAPTDVLALIACGDFKLSRAALASMTSGNAFPSLLSSYFAASGDDAFARAHWPSVSESATLSHQNASALRGLAHMAEAMGEQHAAADMLSRARTASQAPPLWPEFEAGSTRAALSRWCDLARECYRGEKGAWPQQNGVSAGDVVVGFVNGMFGFAPDAARNRLRLRPQIPEEWSRVVIRNLRIGEATVDLSYQRNETGCQFDASQSSGAYPVRLIFEPALVVPVLSVTVDLRSAALDMRPFGERIVAPVQIVLDDRRSLRFELQATKNPHP